MEMFGAEDDVADWFKNVIDDTKDKLDDQKKIMAKLGIKMP